MIHHIDHVNIVVRDLETSAAFYTRLLGLREARRAHLEGEWIESVVGLKGVRADVVYVQPEGGGPRIELLQYHAPEGIMLPACALPNTRGLRHIAFRVDNMAAISRKLREAGVPFLSEPVTVPGAVVRHDAGEKTLCYFHDPDGVLLELAEYRGG
jgi:catechol 2,3-dioxygenase-like lactoylglutathione lyase family enzyme